MTTSTITNPSIFIKPSDKLSKYIKNLEYDPKMPIGIEDLYHEGHCDTLGIRTRIPIDHKYLIKKADYEFINTLDFVGTDDIPMSLQKYNVQDDDKLLNLEDIHWLYEKIDDNNNSTIDEKVYFHELFENSIVILPENAEIPRNPVLEKRCKMLRAQQQNMEYKAMTKNVDSVRKRHPEDTVAYQMKQMNNHLIAVFQFILSVAAGFAFGFIGVELIVGDLDFGFRILLGIICALTIALAELYFLAKKLNEDINFEEMARISSKSSKID